jgi:hypothetical protein
MPIYLKILIVLAVILIGRKAWVITAGRKRREHQELVRRRKEDAEREEIFSHGRAMKRANAGGAIKSKFGIFDSYGNRVTLNPAEFVSYVRTPTTIRAVELDFEGELRDSRGVRRFSYGDYYCENEAGCCYITSAPYMRQGYKRPPLPSDPDDETKTWPGPEASA